MNNIEKINNESFFDNDIIFSSEDDSIFSSEDDSIPMHESTCPKIVIPFKEDQIAICKQSFIICGAVIPTVILLLIIKKLDHESKFNFALTCKKIACLYRSNIRVKDIFEYYFIRVEYMKKIPQMIEYNNYYYKFPNIINIKDSDVVELLEDDIIESWDGDEGDNQFLDEGDNQFLDEGDNQFLDEGENLECMHSSLHLPLTEQGENKKLDDSYDFSDDSDPNECYEKNKDIFQNNFKILMESDNYDCNLYEIILKANYIEHVCEICKKYSSKLSDHCAVDHSDYCVHCKTFGGDGCSCREVCTDCGGIGGYQCTGCCSCGGQGCDQCIPNWND